MSKEGFAALALLLFILCASVLAAVVIDRNADIEMARINTRIDAQTCPRPSCTYAPPWVSADGKTHYGAVVQCETASDIFFVQAHGMSE